MSIYTPLKRIATPCRRHFSSVKDTLTSYKGRLYPKETFTSLPVRWGDHDALNHVNNVVYFQYFEQARVNWFQNVTKIPLNAVDTHLGNVGIAPIIAQTSCKYKRPVTFPDNLTIAFSSELVDEARGDFKHHYIVYSENQDAVVSEGTADIVSYNYKDKKRVPVPDGWTFE